MTYESKTDEMCRVRDGEAHHLERRSNTTPGISSTTEAAATAPSNSTIRCCLETKGSTAAYQLDIVLLIWSRSATAHCDSETPSTHNMCQQLKCQPTFFHWPMSAACTLSGGPDDRTPGSKCADRCEVCSRHKKSTRYQVQKHDNNFWYSLGNGQAKRPDIQEKPRLSGATLRPHACAVTCQQNAAVRVSCVCNGSSDIKNT